MKKVPYYFAAILFFLLQGCSSGGNMKNSDNALTEREIKDGWKLLFDGKTSAGWIKAKTKSFPAGGWEIKDGSLTINQETRGQDGGGDIVTTSGFENFELSVDFLYKTGANSGIKYFIDIEKDSGNLASIGCEYQILDDKNHPDAKLGIAGNRTLAGLYDLLPPQNKKDNGPDKWNTAKIIVRGSHVQHWLNGIMTLEYDRGTPEWRALVATSKFRTIPGFGEGAKGRILLQDHGDIASFKNIRIREITE